MALVFDARCVACRETLAAPTRGPVCAACWAAVPWYGGDLCTHCGMPVVAGATCRCDTLPPHLSSLVAGARYDGPMRAVIQAFKYGGHQTLGAMLVEHLLEHVPLTLDAIDIVVPVPLHPWRRFTRGFNQAERLARHLGPPVLHALVRWSWTPAQATLPAVARRVNVTRAFRLAPRITATSRHLLRARLAGARVLLVDDVTTTGSTLSACARVLKHAGAKEVHALAIARAE